MAVVVPRSMAPMAPAGSEFPNNVERNHSEGCVMDHWNYSCSCGLITHLLETGAFVRYDASMCQVDHGKKTAFSPISEVLSEFLTGLSALCASERIAVFAREDDRHHHDTPAEYESPLGNLTKKQRQQLVIAAAKTNENIGMKK